MGNKSVELLALGGFPCVGAQKFVSGLFTRIAALRRVPWFTRELQFLLAKLALVD
jgi:hypothetical protein